jgi:hypothetical protein
MLARAHTFTIEGLQTRGQVTMARERKRVSELRSD